MEYVIIGNGIAGTSAAEAIRRLDRQGAITMIADEDEIPYCRPMISNLLAGDIAAERLAIRPSSFYDDLNIKPVLGRRVQSIDPAAGKVRVGDSDLIVPFDRLLIASGADPRISEVPGSQLPGAFCLRNRSQALDIMAAAEHGRKAVVVGGGLVGLKAAHALQSRGLQVVMLIRSAHPLRLQVDASAGRMILAKLREHGLQVLVEAEVAAFEGSGKVLENIVLADGQKIPADLAVIAKGVAPATGFAADGSISLGTGGGIIVNDTLETTVPGIYAAGDVAETMDVARREKRVNAIWPEAVDQGIAAGFNMAGRRVAYRGSLSRNVMRIYGLDIMTAGVVEPPAADDSYEVVAVTDKHRDIYHKLVFRDDRLVGMMLINGIEQGGVLLSLIRREVAIVEKKERLLEPGFQVGKLMPQYFK